MGKSGFRLSGSQIATFKMPHDWYWPSVRTGVEKRIFKDFWVIFQNVAAVKRHRIEVVCPCTMQETKDDLEGNNDSTTFYDNPTTDKSALISTSLFA